MLEWNVYVSDFNAKVIETHNVFDNTSLIYDCKKNYAKNKDDREAFLEQLRRDLMYYYWSKCEWEVVIEHWPPAKGFDDSKVDVYSQVMLNWDRFIDYLWENRKELGKK